MSGHWKLFYQENFITGKKRHFFWPKCFHWVSLWRYCKKEKWKKDFYSCYFIYIWYTQIYVNFIQKIIEKITRLNVKYMFLNAEMEKSVQEENGHVFCCSVLNPVLFWNRSSNMRASRTVGAPKNDFSISIHFKLK